MELRHLKTFQTVAECLSITKAAQQLGYTQPTVTLQMQALEKELCHVLITKVGRSMVLTAAGKQLKQHVDELFILMNKMEKDMEELRDPSGKLMIAASEHYCGQRLHPIIKAYESAYPNVHVHLIPLNSHHALASVKNNVADIAIVAEANETSTIQTLPLEQEHALVVASTKMAQHKTLHHLLQETPFISYDEHCSFASIIDKYFAHHEQQPTSTIVVGGSDAMIKRAVLNDVGYAIIGENAVKKEIEQGIIQALQSIIPVIQTSALFLKARRNEPNIMTFITFLKNAWALKAD